MIGKVSLVLIGLASVANVQTVEGATFAHRSHASVDVLNKHQLSVRGGAGPLDANMMAKANAVIQLAHSASLTLSPTKGLELYGLSYSPMRVFLCGRMFTALLSNAVQYWCMLFGGTSIKTAIGASTIPWIASAVKSLLDGDESKLGVAAFGNYLILAVSGFAAYAIFSGASYADDVAKYLGIWRILNGVGAGLVSQQFSSKWGIKVGNTQETWMTKALGFFVLGTGIYTYALTQGVDPKKAMGYSMMTHLMFCFDSLFVSKEVEKLGTVPKEPFFFWLAFHLATIATLAF